MKRGENLQDAQEKGKWHIQGKMCCVGMNGSDAERLATGDSARAFSQRVDCRCGECRNLERRGFSRAGSIAISRSLRLAIHAGETAIIM
jgi:hypothetical protein